MKFFVDGVDTQEIKRLTEMGLVDGVTTNPSIIAKSGRPFVEVLKEITQLIPGPVSAEVIATDFEGMLKESLSLSKVAPNIVIKVPLTPAGLKTCYHLDQQNIPVNVTLCFSIGQAILAAKAGATYVSPFIGRLDDIGEDGIGLIAAIADIYRNTPDIKTKILGASIRHPRHIIDSFTAGADIVTAPVSVINQLFNHPLTDMGLAQFLKDWTDAGRTAL